MINLSERQLIAFEKYKQGNNIFITGPGGSGKSELIKKIYQCAVDTNKKIQVTALTGCAALLLGCNAKTLHRWSGIGLGNKSIDFHVQRIMDTKKYYMRKARTIWRETDVLVVDEVSMLSLKLFNMLNKIGKAVRRNNKPFGGIQLVFSGDFYQLPPVGSADEQDSSSFCFESLDWEQVFLKENQVPLTYIFRQTDMTYRNVLNQIREGVIKKSTKNLLMGYVGREQNKDSNIRPTKLFPTRCKVDMINRLEMAKLTGQLYEFPIKQVYNFPLNSEDDKNLKKNMDVTEIQAELDYMSNNLPCLPLLSLKVGSQVMCIVNKDITSIQGKPIVLCNGSQGVVVDISVVMNIALPVVRFYCVNGVYEDVIMTSHDWISNNIPGIGISQVPLILAWALTIHKCQGATLDIAEMDIGSGIFECGQTYVALSRVRSLDGLYLTSFDITKIRIHRKVKEFYDSLNDFWETYVFQFVTQEIPVAVPLNLFEKFFYKEKQDAVPIVEAEIVPDEIL